MASRATVTTTLLWALLSSCRLAAAATMQCGVCGHVYDPASDGAGKAFADLPDSWTCPVCGAPKSAYKPQVLADGTVVYVHEHHEHHEDAAATPTVTLNNGVVMPAIAAGTWQYSSAVAEQSVAAALASGYRHIDTAHDYCDSGVAGNCHNNSNQHGIAKALKATSIPRSDIFVTTKVPGCGLQGISRGNCGPDSVAAALENLDELGLDYVDLLLIHFPPPLGCGILNCGTIQKQWAALSEQILKANKTRALGVSNFCVSCLKCLAEVTDAVVPAVNQVQFHVGMGADPEGLMSYAKAQGIAVEAYSPLGDNTTELIDGDLTTRIGAAHNKSSVQVALKWIWQRGHALTTKSSNPKHLAQDIDIFDWQLSSDELTQLDAATKPSGNPSFMCTSR